MAGGIRLQSPGEHTRPTTERVKEAIFSILRERVSGARVLDLYAGTGAMGLEALSRGAESAVFVESDRAACRVLRKNIEKTRLTGAAVRAMPVEAFVGRFPPGGSPFDLIFADPPYRNRDQPASDLLESARLPALLSAGGLLILESRAAAAHAPTRFWRIADVRCYGDTTIHFLIPADE